MISFLAEASQVVLFLLGTFLIIVILLQRGRGGGLAGAFGGMGGQSAFGTKAGDVFTRITIVLAVCWVILAGGSGYLLRAASKGSKYTQGAADATGETGAGEKSNTAGGTAAGETGPETTDGGAPSPSPGALSAPGGESAPAGTESTGTAPAAGGDSPSAPSTRQEPGDASTPPANGPAPDNPVPDPSTSSPQDK